MRDGSRNAGHLWQTAVTAALDSTSDEVTADHAIDYWLVLYFIGQISGLVSRPH